MPKRVLFLCTHNSSRSQMAEGLLRSLGKGEYETFSAGTEKTRVHPLAVDAMKAVGIDITSHTSKTLDEFLDKPFDAVITVCDSAKESCPVFPHAGESLHWSFPDPTKSIGSPADRLDAFKKVRDDIRIRIEAFLQG